MSSSRVANARKFLDAFGRLDKDTLFSMLTPTFVYTFLPSTAPVPPAMTGEVWSGFLDNLRGVLKAYPITIKTVIDCGDAENKVVVWANGNATFKDEVKDDEVDWNFKGEYMIIFNWADDGKLDGILEFIDTKGTLDKLIPLMERAGAKLEKSLKAQA